MAIAVGVAGTLLLTGAAAIGLGRTAWSRGTAAAVTGLRARASLPPSGAGPAFTTGDTADLPLPVARYFAFALPEGQPQVRAATIVWSGEFRSRLEGEWAPFSALQHFTARPPGFVWDARIRMLPAASVYVRDTYLDGRGTMLGRVAALVPVVDEGNSPEMAQSALARWLGEAAWFPTALLPGGAVRWEAVDDVTARAVARDGETEATAEFHFAPTGEITRMTAMRYRATAGTAVLTPFEGRYAAYERREGMMVPTEAEVAWMLPEGRFAYWRGHPQRVEYETSPREIP